MAVEVFMPKMSDHMEAGEIVAWLVQEGERVAERQPILELTTDKVVAELEAPAAGVLLGVRAGVVRGAMVRVGETIAYIAQPGEQVPVLPPLSGAEPQAPEPQMAAGPAAVGEPREGAEAGRVPASPASRALAKKLGVDLALVAGTGPGGRIKEEDVRAFHDARQAAEAASGVAPATPVARRVAQDLGVDLAAVQGTGPGGRVTREDVQALAPRGPAPATGEDVEWVDLNPIQRLTGQRMLESLQAAPQFALTASVDMSAALEWRRAAGEAIAKEGGERPSVTAILVRVVAASLLRCPRANASFEGGRIKLYRRVNVGVAVGSDQGLVVPVIRDADRKTLAEIARELVALQEKAKAMRLTTEDLAGGTFTLSNLGMYAVDHFTAIINPPQSAILAVGRIANTPVALPDGSVAVRPLMALTLSVDHRCMDGVQGAAFLAEVRERLEKPLLLL